MNIQILGKRKKAASTAIAVALLIVVAVALVGGIWYVSQRYTTGSDVVQVQAFKVQNTYSQTSSGTKQISVVGLRLIPKTDKFFTISKIVMTLTMSDGSTQIVEVTNQSGTWQPSTSVAGITIEGKGPSTVSAGQSVELTFTIITDLTSTSGNQITSIVFQVVLKDPSGKEYTYTSNTVSLT